MIFLEFVRLCSIYRVVKGGGSDVNFGGRNSDRGRQTGGDNHHALLQQWLLGSEHDSPSQDRDSAVSGDELSNRKPSSIFSFESGKIVGRKVGVDDRSDEIGEWRWRWRRVVLYGCPRGYLPLCDFHSSCVGLLSAVVKKLKSEFLC